MIHGHDIYYKQNDIIVRRSFPSDADMLAPRLRKSDINEIWASNNLTAWEAIHEGILHSVLSLTITVDGVVVGVFGINAESVLGRKAVIWLLASDDLDRIKLRFLKHSRSFIHMFLMIYPYLWNYVDVRNRQSISWLKFCGAKFNKPEPYGIMRKPFRYFWFERAT